MLCGHDNLAINAQKGIVRKATPLASQSIGSLNSHALFEWQCGCPSLHKLHSLISNNIALRYGFYLAEDSSLCTNSNIHNFISRKIAILKQKHHQQLHIARKPNGAEVGSLCVVSKHSPFQFAIAAIYKGKIGLILV